MDLSLILAVQVTPREFPILTGFFFSILRGKALLSLDAHSLWRFSRWRIRARSLLFPPPRNHLMDARENERKL